MLIKFENVSKWYRDGTVALDNVTCQINSGEFCVLLGHSGAGKSTLLRSINGLVDPSSGNVTVNGLQVNRKNLLKVRREVAMIHQDYNLSGRSTVATNVMSGALPDVPWGLALLGWFPSFIRKKACVLLEKVGLEEKHLNRRARSLSGGQQQRVGIARSLILDPSIILADEPIASLDPSSSLEIMFMLKDIARETGCTVLCSLHQVDLARKFADRIIGMESGQVVFDLRSDELDERALKMIYKNFESVDGSDIMKSTEVDQMIGSSLMLNKSSKEVGV